MRSSSAPSSCVGNGVSPMRCGMGMRSSYQMGYWKCGGALAIVGRVLWPPAAAVCGIWDSVQVVPKWGAGILGRLAGNRASSSLGRNEMPAPPILWGGEWGPG